MTQKKIPGLLNGLTPRRLLMVKPPCAAAAPSLGAAHGYVPPDQATFEGGHEQEEHHAGHARRPPRGPEPEIVHARGRLEDHPAHATIRAPHLGADSAGH